VNESHRRAADLARFYFRQIAEQSGVRWGADNDVEVELMVSYIIDAAQAQVVELLETALGRIRALEGALSLPGEPQEQTLTGPSEQDVSAADMTMLDVPPGRVRRYVQPSSEDGAS
jgi:hypothetical protein